MASAEKNLLDALVVALQAIDGAAPFATDLGDRIYLGRSYNEEPRTEAHGQPYLEIAERLPGPRPLVTEASGAGIGGSGLSYLMTLPVELHLSIHGLAGADLDERMRQFEEDCIAAIEADQNLPLNDEWTIHYPSYQGRDPVGVFPDINGWQRIRLFYTFVYRKPSVLGGGP